MTGNGADIARELLDGAGIAERDDPGGPRWVAIRHADDHIHIAAVLVRQDTGRRFWPHHDYPKLRSTARAIEQRLGLTITAVADDTAARRPGRGETEKAARHGRGPARPELRRAAHEAAIRAGGPEEFVAELRVIGYRAELRRGPSGDALGYRIGKPGDVTAAGQQVFYSGSMLAPDLSLPQLRRRWAQNGCGRQRHRPSGVQRDHRRGGGAGSSLVSAGQLGRVAFEVRDHGAFHSCTNAFRDAYNLARHVFVPPGSERVLRGAVDIASDAFFPALVKRDLRATPSRLRPAAAGAATPPQRSASAPYPRPPTSGMGR